MHRHWIPCRLATVGTSLKPFMSLLQPPLAERCGPSIAGCIAPMEPSSRSALVERSPTPTRGTFQNRPSPRPLGVFRGGGNHGDQPMSYDIMLVTS